MELIPDQASNSTPHATSSTTSNDPVQKFPQWLKLRKEIEEDENNVQAWEELFSFFENLVATQTQVIKKNDTLNNSLIDTIDRLLLKFPFLLDYWKRYVTIVYTLSGLESSIEVLEKSVTLFPQSLDLWLDYLNILISNNLKESDGLKRIFEDAISHVGRQFLSHPLWDLYLEWQSNCFGKASTDYIKTLLRVLQFPLHQYAKYFETFYDIKDKFAITDLIDDSSLQEVIEQYYPGSEISSLSEEQINYLIDTYFNTLFESTQNKTNERWSFESDLNKQAFDFSPISASDMTNWINYIEFEQANGDTQQTKSLFERALIPLCTVEQIWIRYLNYLIKISEDKNYIIYLFNRACDTFVPMTNTKIKYMYAEYYEKKLDDFEQAKRIYLSLIFDSPTSCEPVEKYFLFILRHKDQQLITEQSIATVRKYINKHYISQQVGEPSKKKQKLIHAEVTDSDFQDLYKVSTYRNVTQLIVEVAKIYWFKENKIKDTRDLLVSFYKQEIVKCSLEYWSFFFKFEMAQRNKTNVKNIVNYLKYKGQLSTLAINNFIQVYVDFMIKNSSQEELVKDSREILRYYMEVDPESSTHVKHFLKSRLDAHDDEEATNASLIKENGHPGIVQSRPAITNQLDSCIKLSQMPVPRLPQFTNVEKANAPPKYVYESL